MKKIDWYEIFTEYIVPAICGFVGAVIGILIMSALSN